MPKQLPQNRGLWIWRLKNTEDGDLEKIVASCGELHISWVAIKSANAGVPWKQFTKELVDRLHAAGVRVFGWGYDVPGTASKQAKCIKTVADTGADGYIIDPEVEWEQCANPDMQAKGYCAAIAELKLRDDFLIGDAPWAIVAGHTKFPFTEFGKFVDFRVPQVYWTEIGGSAEEIWGRHATSWKRYENWLRTSRKPPAPEAIKPRIPDGSCYSAAYPIGLEDVAWFERNAKNIGAGAVLYWSWQTCPENVREWFKANPF